MLLFYNSTGMEYIVNHKYHYFNRKGPHISFIIIGHTCTNDMKFVKYKNCRVYKLTTFGVFPTLILL